jgi:hypothetical protein
MYHANGVKPSTIVVQTRDTQYVAEEIIKSYLFVVKNIYLYYLLR